MDIPFLTRGQKPKHIALVDVGSASVGFAIVSVQHDAPARIVASRRAVLSQAERTDSQRLGGIKRLFEEAGTRFFDQAARDGFTTVEKALVVVHAPLSQSRSAQADRTFQTSTRVTRDTVSSLANEALRETETLTGDVFERTVIRVELNGYPTAHPEGKEAQEAAVTLAVSAMVPELRALVREQLARLLPGRSLTVRSSLTVYSMLLRDIAKRTSDYTILDMTSTASACIAVRDGAVTQHGLIPAGIDSLVYTVANESHAAPDEVRSLIRLLSEDACEAASCAAVAKAVASAERKLMRTFGEGFSALVATRRLPNTLVLAVHPDLEAWARAFFGRLDFSQFTVTGRPFTVQVISTEHLEPYVTIAPEATTDAGLAAGAAFARLLER